MNDFDIRMGLGVAMASGLIGSVVFFVPLWGPQLALRGLLPPDSPEPVPHAHRFSLAEALVLTSHLALANAIVALIRDATTSDRVVVFLSATLNLLVLMIWVNGSRFAIRCGIKTQGGRLRFLGVIYPLAVILVGEIVTTAMMLVSMLEAFEKGFSQWLTAYLSHAITQGAAIVLLAAAAALHVLRKAFQNLLRAEGIRAIASEASDDPVREK